MPGPHGEILPDEMQKIQQWIDARWQNRKCPACGLNDWASSSYYFKDLVGARDFHVGPAAKFMPYVAFFCQNCGYAMRFNALLMGVYLNEPKAGDAHAG
ncbi:MAG TPA: hypothetical protein VK176_01690 [Phycisphaerales bacterium]|nr:hypothetical protein [Phycisphaerales bacterium]